MRKVLVPLFMLSLFGFPVIALAGYPGQYGNFSDPAIEGCDRFREPGYQYVYRDGVCYKYSLYATTGGATNYQTPPVVGYSTNSPTHSTNYEVAQVVPSSNQPGYFVAPQAGVDALEASMLRAIIFSAVLTLSVLALAQWRLVKRLIFT